jgi:hypothetical protein
MKLYSKTVTAFNLIFLTINIFVSNKQIWNKSAEIFRVSGSVLKVADSDDSGWHAIQVYYGIRESLPPNFTPEPWAPGSQLGQDRLVMALMNEYKKLVPVESYKTHPFFVDLAANDAVRLSNTYMLEKHNWTGLCVEPNPMYWERLAHRKCTVIGAFVGGQDQQPVNVTTMAKGAFGGIVDKNMDNKPTTNGETKLKYTVSLRTLFHRNSVPHEIDYFSLDVEGAESMIMKNFPFDEYSFRFLTVERPKEDLKSLLKSHGYEYIQDLSIWGETFWVHESMIHLGLSKELIQTVISATIKE